MIPVANLAAQCAPFVAPSTLAALVRVESGGNPLAMWNNSTRSMVIPANRAQAVRYLQSAMAAGQKVDVGIAQVDTQNFASYGITPQTAFDACTNLRVGAEILRADWQRAFAAGYSGQPALYHAFEAYNSGRLWGDAAYANRILGAAGVPVTVHGDGGLRHAIPHHPVNPFPLIAWPGLAQPLPAAKPVSWPVLP